MRNKGYTRPLSVLQIRSTIRAKYSRLSKKVMLEMLTPKRNLLVRFMYVFICFYISVMANSLITCLKPSPFVSAQLLCEIHIWKEVLGLTWEDIISRLRPRTVPSGYKFHSWIPGNTSCTYFCECSNIYLYLIIAVGKREEEVDKLRSILAQLEFTHTVREYERNGVPFRHHLHVPEVHPETGNVFYEREDPAHVLKVHLHLHTALFIHNNLYRGWPGVLVMEVQRTLI